MGLAASPVMAAEAGPTSWQEARIHLFDDALDATERRESVRKEVAKKRPKKKRPKKKKPAIEFELEGNIEAEMRMFTNDVDMRDTYQLNFSFGADPILEMFWGRGDQSLTVNPFLRVDQHDRERTHWDIRQLKWIGVFDNWELRAGIDRVFWGVTESAHLVDIINQDDQLEDIDGEDKLGQPLVSASYQSGWGTITAYLLPYFRDRKFPGRKGRPSGPILVDEEQAVFGAGDNRWLLDWALRYTNYFGPIDIGMSYFNGLSRNPVLLPGLNAAGELALTPFYDKINQVGVDTQLTLGAWLFKFEGITVDARNSDRHWSFASGFEYTFYEVFGSGADIGLLVEYLWDSRGQIGPSASESDLFFGVRWEGNDVSTTRVLGGVVLDLDTSSKAVFVEASRRVGENWRITLDARFFLSVPPGDPLFLFRTEDFVQLRLARFF